MRINLRIKNEDVGFQIFDALYAFKQSLDYSGNLNIVINQPPMLGDCSVLCVNMFSDTSVEETKQYDLVFMSNGGEPLTDATPWMTELIQQDNTYLISNSFLTQEHQLFNKVITWPDSFMLCRDYWCRHFYPQYFENLKNWNKKENQKKKWTITAINGQNRTWRHWLFFELLPTVPNINIVTNLGSSVTRLNDPHWASTEDLMFHEWLNSRFDFATPEPNSYYPNVKMIGIDGKFGEVPPGYFIMPEYWQSNCVLWPETTWQNNEIAVTEKACKCFYSKTIPWPVGGANIHTLYNQQGFYTAWNLLPPEHQQFDSILDHVTRYHALTRALIWATENPEIFYSKQANEMLQSNQTTFLLGLDSIVNIATNMDKMFQQYAKQ
jgi:hypothetical protein